MSEYVKVVNANDPYDDPQAVEQIMDPSTQEPFPDGQSYYYPGQNITQGGVTATFTNDFSLNCKEAEDILKEFVPHRFLPPERLIILTDGTCGSTCASFTKIAQEAEKATFVGAGGLWGQPMGSCFFVYLFVCGARVCVHMCIAHD